MGTICCIEVEDNVLYSEGEIVARVDLDGDLSVYCHELGCAYRTNIPMTHIEQLVEFWKKNKKRYSRKDNAQF